MFNVPDLSKVTDKIQEVAGGVLAYLRDINETLILTKEVLVDNQKILMEIRENTHTRTPGITGKLSKQPPAYEPEVK